MELKCRKFTFQGKENNLDVLIPEKLDPAYGMYVWPAAPVLAQYIWYQRSTITGKIVLELGSGTALAGIVAAKVGGHVIFSDGCHLPECQEMAILSCKANQIDHPKVIGITWGQFTSELIKLNPPDIVIGSDCFYDTKDFEDIICTVKYLSEKNHKLEFWTSYQERSSTRSIEPLLDKWNLKCVHVPLFQFDADCPDLAGTSLPGNHTIQMLVISRK